MHESRSPRTVHTLASSYAPSTSTTRGEKERTQNPAPCNVSVRPPSTLQLWRVVWLYPSPSPVGCEIQKVGACLRAIAICCLLRTQEHPEPEKGKIVPHTVTSSAQAVRALSVSVRKCPSPGPILMLQSYRVREDSSFPNA